MPVFLDRQNRLECPAAPAPGCRSAREPGRVGLNAATTGTAGRRRLRVPMPATWASATAFSPDRPAKRPVGAADFTLEPGRAQPSRGESISFLSPARAAGAPTFCDATESRQRTQPRGLRPLGHPPPDWAANHQPRKFGPSPTPLEAVHLPGWSAQRHRPRGAARHSNRAVSALSVGNSGYSWALTVASSSVRFLGFGYGFLARMDSKTPGGRGGFYPRARRGPTLSGRINLFPLPRSSRGGSYFL